MEIKTTRSEKAKERQKKGLSCVLSRRSLESVAGKPQAKKGLSCVAAGEEGKGNKK